MPCQTLRPILTPWPGAVRKAIGSAGPFSVSSANVGVGLVGGDADQGLLGQSFLSRFDVTISKKELVLRKPR